MKSRNKDDLMASGREDLGEEHERVHIKPALPRGRRRNFMLVSGGRA